MKQIAEKCPICEGRGTVSHNFYADGIGICRSCQGRGIIFVWDTTPEPTNPWIKPLPPNPFEGDCYRWPYKRNVWLTY